MSFKMCCHKPVQLCPVYHHTTAVTGGACLVWKKRDKVPDVARCGSFVASKHPLHASKIADASHKYPPTIGQGPFFAHSERGGTLGAHIFANSPNFSIHACAPRLSSHPHHQLPQPGQVNLHYHTLAR